MANEYCKHGAVTRHCVKCGLEDMTAQLIAELRRGHELMLKLESALLERKQGGKR